MKAIGYIRVSTDEQSLGPEVQLHALQVWCTQHDVELLTYFTDEGISGAAKLEDREGLSAALEAIAVHRAGMLLIAKRDRLARDVLLVALIEGLLQKHGARLVSVAGEGTDADPDDPTAMLLRGMIDLFAQYERFVIRLRTRAALAVKKRRGELFSGRAPYGFSIVVDEKAPPRFRRDGSQKPALKLLIENAREQSAMKLIRQLRADGASARDIVERLHTEQVPCRGTRWHETTILRILAKEIS